MARIVGIGYQDFGDLIKEQCFYIDKTDFIREWWENRDKVTLITRPRRFGKTLTMSMTEYFFLTSMRSGEICLRTCPSGRKKVIAGCRGNIL